MNLNFPDRDGAVAADVSSFAADLVLPAGVGVRDLRKAARDVADQAFARAALYDEDGAYPLADVAALAERGLLTATLPRELGGDGIGPLALSEVLRQIGAGSLPLGRLFEGHVNALDLVVRYGDDEQVAPRRGRGPRRQAIRGLEHRRQRGSAPPRRSRKASAARTEDPGLRRRLHRASARHCDG